VVYDISCIEISTSEIVVYDDLPDLLKGLLQSRLEFNTQDQINTYFFKTKKAQELVANGLQPSGARVLLSVFGSWSPVANMPLEFRDLPPAERVAKAKEVIAKSLEDKKLPLSWPDPSRGPPKEVCGQPTTTCPRRLGTCRRRKG